MSDSINEQRCEHGKTSWHYIDCKCGQPIPHQARCPGPSVPTPPAEKSLCYWNGSDCLCGANASLTPEQRRARCRGSVAASLTPPAEQPEPKCKCGHSAGFHRKSAPSPCKLKCWCQGFEPVAATSPVTDPNDELASKALRRIGEIVRTMRSLPMTPGLADYLSDIANLASGGCEHGVLPADACSDCSRTITSGSWVQSVPMRADENEAGRG